MRPQGPRSTRRVAQEGAQASRRSLVGSRTAPSRNFAGPLDRVHPEASRPHAVSSARAAPGAAGRGRCGPRRAHDQFEVARAQRSRSRIPWIVHSDSEEKIPLGLDCFSGGGRARNDCEDCSFARQVELAGFLTHRVPPQGGTRCVRVPCSGLAILAQRPERASCTPRLDPARKQPFHGRAPPSVAHQLAAVGVIACAITGFSPLIPSVGTSGRPT